MNNDIPEFKNPFKPGAGHMPPYLAGRHEEKAEFLRLVGQDTILENMVLTGLRGVGKTVLLETFKPLAIGKHWLWVGTDLSESSSVNEESIALRFITDLSVVTSSMEIGKEQARTIGFHGATEEIPQTLNYNVLVHAYHETPGLVIDKLKAILHLVAGTLKKKGNIKGIIFAYDEAQNLSDHAEKGQYPMSLLLDVFQSVQRTDIPFMLVLTGLPTLFPKLVEARTFAERMFRVVFLDQLNEEESREAITKPIESAECPVKFNTDSINIIVESSGGYPYFIQFICRETFDVFIQKIGAGDEPLVPVDSIIRKLDTDFFAGRWARATDRQRDLLLIIAQLPNSEPEFTVREIVALSKELLDNSFSNSHANQMLSTLSDAGLVYKNRHGKYSFAVPLFGPFLLRQLAQGE